MQTEAIERLERWRDVGDGPFSYCAGDARFANDVISALSEIDRLRCGVKEIDRFLDENRIGDASFVCAALLAE